MFIKFRFKSLCVRLIYKIIVVFFYIYLDKTLICFFFCQTTLICFFLRKYSIGFGEAALNPTGRKCPDPNGVDKKAACYSYCKTQGFMGGSCQGHKGNYMCKCYEGI